MLVLTRKNEQKIFIGTEEDFKNGTQTGITVFVRNNQVKLGFDVNPNIIVLREEVYNSNYGIDNPPKVRE